MHVKIQIPGPCLRSAESESPVWSLESVFAECLPRDSAGCPVSVGLWSPSLGTYLTVSSRAEGQGMDPGMNKHLHSLQPRQTLPSTGSVGHAGEGNGHFNTPIFFQVIGFLTRLNNLIIYYGLCGESLFELN